ncbi:MAG: glutathione S-transferase family protein [Hyphomicrobiales bacterium]
MIEIWGRRSSSNVQAVMWCLAELNLEVNRKDAGYIYGVVDTPEYLDMNPNGTIPTIRDGDNTPLWESGAILRYLSNTYAPKIFWPHDPVARARVDQWAEWAKINFAGKFTAPIFQKLVRTAPSKRNYSEIEAAILVVDKYLDIAELQLTQNQYLAGDDLTLADIQFGHCLYRYFDIDIKRPERNNLKRYYENLCARPAYNENVVISYDELRIFD